MGSGIVPHWRQRGWLCTLLFQVDMLDRIYRTPQKLWAHTLKFLHRVGREKLQTGFADSRTRSTNVRDFCGHRVSS